MANIILIDIFKKIKSTISGLNIFIDSQKEHILYRKYFNHLVKNNIDLYYDEKIIAEEKEKFKQKKQKQKKILHMKQIKELTVFKSSFAQYTIKKKILVEKILQALSIKHRLEKIKFSLIFKKNQFQNKILLYDVIRLKQEATSIKDNLLTKIGLWGMPVAAISSMTSIELIISALAIIIAVIYENNSTYQEKQYYYKSIQPYLSTTFKNELQKQYDKFFSKQSNHEKSTTSFIGFDNTHTSYIL